MGDCNILSPDGLSADACGFSTSLAVDLAFANDLNILPAVLSFLLPGFESDLLSIVAPTDGEDADRPDTLSPGFCIGSLDLFKFMLDFAVAFTPASNL